MNPGLINRVEDPLGVASLLVEHQGSPTIVHKFIKEGYYCPTLFKYSHSKNVKPANR